MIDVKAVRDDPEAFKRGISKKHADTGLVDRLLEVDRRRRELQVESDELRNRQKKAGKEIASADDEQKQALLDAMTTLKTERERLDGELEGVSAEVDALLAEIPNPAHESVPEGAGEDGNVTVATVGEAESPEWLADHQEVASRLGVVDMERAAEVSGSRFAYLLGDAVLVQLALERLAIDTLVPEGFVPVVPPVLVREAAMFGTGFFPTDRHQIYETGQDDLFLVGTSEVPLAAFHADEILDLDSLPLRYLGFSTCFRREAGTHGKDTRGIFRVHQFDKVEMFSFCSPEKSWEEHEFLLACERKIFDALELSYRVVNVCGGDLGASAAKKYDIEAWLPSEGRYREATSTSNTTDYQARRLRVRTRMGNENVPVHTLNGTAVAIGRALTFLLEQHQQRDGSVVMPAALVERGAPERLRGRI
ncbi:MAG: serine--tRNA ligase [Actinobacteria bacterium ATB1]|nr:serine--tRNA ligase [Actinobacteria bacterium ATB1]